MTRITKKATVEIASELETGRKGWEDFYRRYEWVQAHFILGAPLPLYRGLSLTRGMEPERVVSASLDKLVVLRMLREQPGMIFVGDNIVHPENVVLTYTIPQNESGRIMVVVPDVIDKIRNRFSDQELSRMRAGRRVRMPVLEILEEAYKEQEVIVNVTGLDPEIERFTYAEMWDEMERIWKKRGKLKGRGI